VQVWGPIFALTAAYVIYQLLPVTKDDPFFDRLGVLQLVNFWGVSLWTICFSHLQLWPANFLIFAVLIALLLAYKLLGIGMRKVVWAEKAFVHWTISANLSWLLVANLASITLTLKANGFSAPEDWGTAWVFIATVIAFYVAMSRADVAYCAVFIWACAGIAAKQWPLPTLRDTCIVGAVLVGVTLLKALHHEYRHAIYTPDGCKANALTLRSFGIFDDYRELSLQKAGEDNDSRGRHGTPFVADA